MFAFDHCCGLEGSLIKDYNFGNQIQTRCKLIKSMIWEPSVFPEYNLPLILEAPHTSGVLVLYMIFLSLTL